MGEKGGRVKMRILRRGKTDTAAQTANTVPYLLRERIPKLYSKNYLCFTQPFGMQRTAQRHCEARRTPDGRVPTSGFVLLRGLITMFLVLLCLAGILFSLSAISRRSSVFREKVYKEIEQRNEDSKSLLMSGERGAF